MTDYVGLVTVPEVVPTGTFPILPDYGYGRAHQPKVAIHQFGAANAKLEQRFLLGSGAKRFTVRRARMRESDRQALRDFWEDSYGPYGAFTYNAPNDNGLGTTAFTCRFANEPLSWEMLSNTVSSLGVTLVEIPSSSPTYPLNSTVTRFPSDALKTALLDQVQIIIPLIKIQPRASGYPAIYVSDRRCTIGSQLYLPRLLEFDNISQGMGNESDEASFVFGNADRVMTKLVNGVSLDHATLEFSLYHVGTGIKLDLWKGNIVDWDSADGGPEFPIKAADGLYELTLPYPTRRISRTCWKSFNDGANCPYASESPGLDTTHFPSADATKCDKSYDADNGCLAHQMKHRFGGVIAEPQGVNIKDNSQGFWGFGRPTITATSIVQDSVYDELIPEIYTNGEEWTDTDGIVHYGRKVNCKIAAGRDESDFYEALGIVGEGPVTFGEGHQLDGQYNHGWPGFGGLRQINGNDPAGGGDYISLDQAGDQRGGDWRKVFTGGLTFKDNFSAGLAALVIRRSDQPGIQPSMPSGHAMTAMVEYGLKGWIWTAPGTRTWDTLTNNVWVSVNAALKARGLLLASAATAEQEFDVTSAIAAADICDTIVDKLIGAGDEQQFSFLGILDTEKPARDWITEILMNCLGFFTFSFGKLDIGIKCNSSAVEAFTVGNILFKSLHLKPIKPSFNHLMANFADAQYAFAGNNVPVYDEDHAKLLGGSGSPLYLRSQINLSGVSDKSHAARIGMVRLREELGGINATQWAAAREIGFGTTVLALNTKLGMVCSMTHPDMPDGVLDGTPTPNYGEFRVARWKLGKDWSIAIEGKTTVDEMYDLTVGPKPADVQPDPVPAEPTPTLVDTGNPSGASTLSLLTNADDPHIPSWNASLQFSRETSNYKTIDGVVVVLSSALPAEGPFAAERAAHTGQTVESGTCSITAGHRKINIPARSSAPGVIGRVLLIFTGDGDLQGQMVESEGAGYIMAAQAFSKSGTFSYAVIKRIWDFATAGESGNSFYFFVPVDQFGGIEQTTWRTPPIALPEGTFYLTVYSHNRFGLGTRLTAGPITITYQGTVTTDTDNPSGCSSASIQTNLTDSRVPAGSMAFRFNRDLYNYKSIFRVEVVLRAASPDTAAHGAYAAQRSAHGGDVLASGSGVTIVRGNPIISLTILSPAPPALNGELFLIFQSGGDQGLDGSVITTHASDHIVINDPIRKSGTFDWAVIEPPWNLNAWEAGFNFPDDFINQGADEPVWQTKPVPLYPDLGNTKCEIYTRNIFGMTQL